MDEERAFCVNCLQEVDSSTHQNCTLNFDSLLAPEDRYDVENFQKKQAELTMERLEVKNAGALQGEDETLNLSIKKQDFIIPEISTQNPLKVVSSTRNSTSSRILGANNLGIHHSQSTECGNSISRPKEYYGLHNNASSVHHANANDSAANLQTSSAYSQGTYSNQIVEQTAFGSMVVQENDFQNTKAQNNDRGFFNQKTPYSNYEKRFVRHNLQPSTIPAFRTAFPKPILKPNMSTFEPMRHEQNICHPTLQNQYVPYELHPDLTYSYNTRHEEKYAVNLNILPRGLENTVVINYTPENQVSVSKEKAFVGQKDYLSTSLVSSTEMQTKNKNESKTIQHNTILNTLPRNIQQKNNDKSTPQNNLESMAHQTNEVTSVHKEHVWKIKQKNKQEKIDLQKNTQKIKDSQIGIKKGKDSQKFMQQEKDLQMGMNRENDFQKVMPQDNDSQKVMPQENDTQMGTQQENDSQMENGGRFTGEGYKSIDEFIKALYDGTLYKRF